MHFKASIPARSLVFGCRILIAGLITLAILAVQLPDISRPIDRSGVASIAICVTPFGVIVSGILSRRDWLETVGWGVLVVAFVLRLYA